MQDDIAELRRQLEEERRAREEAEQRLRPNSLFRLLDRCHESVTDDPSRDESDPDDPRQRD